MNQVNKPFWDTNIPANFKDSLNIILLAHVQEPRGNLNHSQIQCSKTERFSIEEFGEIYQGIVTAGYYIQGTYYNELDFISDYIEHPERFKNCLVYNLSRNGIGDNKKTIIPAFCELLGLRYSTSSSFSCALCRNKYYFSSLLKAHGIPTPRSWFLTDTGDWLNGAPAEYTRVICKPCSESASQGVHKDSVFTYSSSMFEHSNGKQYIIQEYIDGNECEVPIFKFGDSVKVLPPVGIDLQGSNILDEKASAENCYGFYPLTEAQDATTIDNIKKYATKAFDLLNMDVYGRIDFRIDQYGKPYIFDVSTTPYTTKHSSFAFAFEQLGYKYSDIYQAIISAAFQRMQH